MSIQLATDGMSEQPTMSLRDKILYAFNQLKSKCEDAEWRWCIDDELDNLGDLLLQQEVVGEEQYVPPNTYELQRDLMQRSGQDLPTQVYITPQSIMYAALNLEELGETLTALSDAIHGADADSICGNYVIRAAVGFSKAADDMALSGGVLKKYAQGLRAIVAENFISNPPEGEMPQLAITLEHAVEIADGCVDGAVVNAGLTLSLGLPGTKCYDNVVLSNLSKVNPETGVIDKEKDGKWIKGPNYKKPDLASIIAPLLWRSPMPWTPLEAE